ncbi:unnamed protein product [marine sediment metagenome]|uniref:Uncharacterized protein n=1 Tax=marine sediment metagenome TaxID=412755 RepID=X1DB53_9ZZZZ
MGFKDSINISYALVYEKNIKMVSQMIRRKVNLKKKSGIPKLRETLFRVIGNKYGKKSMG